MIQNRSSLLVNQILSIMIQNRPFDTHLASSLTNPTLLTPDLVSDVLRSIPRFFFHPTRSIGRQITTRHRAPLKQRNLKQESIKCLNNVLVLGPAAHRDPERVNLGVDKAMQFFNWVEAHSEGTHTEMSCKEMAIVFIRGNQPRKLWCFLKEMTLLERGKGKDKDKGVKVITTSFITCLIKMLGQEGFVNEGLALFYRMKQYHCKPDVYAYNTIIYALCRVGNFQKARFLFEQMELPGFRCPPDTFTYTILISAYCKYSQQTGCRKAMRMRLYKANYLFRTMLFKGFVPDVVTYNCLIDGCCKTYRIERALELFEDMSKRGCVPNRVTYNSFIRYYSAVNEIDKAVEMLRRMQTMNHGLATSSSYTPIIHAMCEAQRVLEARDLLVELVDGGSVPREYTYELVCSAMKSVTEENLLDDEFHKRIRGGIEYRFKQVKKVKPIMMRSC
ncbi:Pentatricopeptide repeat (PPR) superfamily protein [Euphorbia peplus]|nr:Pentatricopeptide repeat (PPR) superfamily protein [Euphorbia peplus]